MMMNINLKREKEIYRELEKRNNKDNKNLQLKPIIDLDKTILINLKQVSKSKLVTNNTQINSSTKSGLMIKLRDRIKKEDL